MSKIQTTVCCLKDTWSGMMIEWANKRDGNGHERKRKGDRGTNGIKEQKNC
jgi:hypothetical protein